MYDVQVLEVGVSSITVADYRKGCVVDVTYLYSEGLDGRLFYKARLPRRKKWVKDEKLVGLLQKLFGSVNLLGDGSYIPCQPLDCASGSEGFRFYWNKGRLVIECLFLGDFPNRFVAMDGLTGLGWEFMGDLMYWYGWGRQEGGTLALWLKSGSRTVTNVFFFEGCALGGTGEKLPYLSAAQLVFR